MGPTTLKAEWSTVLGETGHKFVEMEHGEECLEMSSATTLQTVSCCSPFTIYTMIFRPHSCSLFPDQRTGTVIYLGAVVTSGYYSAEELPMSFVNISTRVRCKPRAMFNSCVGEPHDQGSGCGNSFASAACPGKRFGVQYRYKYNHATYVQIL